MDLNTIVGSLIRNGGGALAAFLAGKGVFTSSDEQSMVIAAVVAVGAVVWSLFQKKFFAAKVAKATVAETE